MKAFRRLTRVILLGIMCSTLLFFYWSHKFTNLDSLKFKISKIKKDIIEDNYVKPSSDGVDGRGILTNESSLVDTASAISQKHSVVTFSVINDGAHGDRGILTDERGLVDAASAIAKKHGVVLFSVINDAFIQVAASWLCNTAPLRHLHSKVLFLTTDASTGQRLQKHWPQINVAFVNSSAFSGDKKYSTVSYVRLMVERTRFIQRLVQAGIRLLLFEVDFVWLADPLPTVLSYDADVVGVQVYGTKGKLICGCFLLLNSTPATVKVWSRLTQMMEKLYRKIEAKGPNAHVSEGTNDQTFLSQLLNQKYGDVKRAYLPENLFPEGKWYMEGKLRAAQPNPLIIHNNWIIGTKTKIDRAKQFNHWFLSVKSTSSNLICNDTAVNGVTTRMGKPTFV